MLPESPYILERSKSQEGRCAHTFTARLSGNSRSTKIRTQLATTIGPLAFEASEEMVRTLGSIVELKSALVVWLRKRHGAVPCEARNIFAE
jgi:hypothetical protein